MQKKLAIIVSDTTGQKHDTMTAMQHRNNNNNMTATVTTNCGILAYLFLPDE